MNVRLRRWKESSSFLLDLLIVDDGGSKLTHATIIWRVHCPLEAIMFLWLIAKNVILIWIVSKKKTIERTQYLCAIWTMTRNWLYTSH